MQCSERRAAWKSGIKCLRAHGCVPNPRLQGRAPSFKWGRRLAPIPTVVPLLRGSLDRPPRARRFISNALRRRLELLLERRGLVVSERGVLSAEQLDLERRLVRRALLCELRHARGFLRVLLVTRGGGL